ncbi:Uncharacterized protein APZ42_028415 [Daphnia magna]|uniref:CxC3 like cysteine cluster domain-containing protein n=1 Tax=Daphnia magna TaxID=35525 RepID=A0A164QJ66_9CRUS|nr:Uncharacterized protein APZ42_028415 [Daphnia magna]
MTVTVYNIILLGYQSPKSLHQQVPFGLQLMVYIFTRGEAKPYSRFAKVGYPLSIVLPEEQTVSGILWRPGQTLSGTSRSEINCGLTKEVYITKEGLFVFNTTDFMSSVCNASHLATKEEYMCFGYWPSSSSNNNSFIEEDLLCLWKSRLVTIGLILSIARFSTVLEGSLNISSIPRTKKFSDVTGLAKFHTVCTPMLTESYTAFLQQKSE